MSAQAAQNDAQPDTTAGAASVRLGTEHKPRRTRGPSKKLRAALAEARAEGFQAGAERAAPIAWLMTAVGLVVGLACGAGWF
jgi:hypothetical protein